jgi:hypothetical protein
VVNVIGVVPVDNEVTLLGGEDWAASEGRIYVKGCGLSSVWCINNDQVNIIKSSPVAPKILDIDLIVN